MLLINKLAEPGGIRRVELRLDTVKVVLKDGTEHLYTNNRPQHIEQADFGYLGAMADRERD